MPAFFSTIVSFNGEHDFPSCDGQPDFLVVLACLWYLNEKLLEVYKLKNQTSAYIMPVSIF